MRLLLPILVLASLVSACQEESFLRLQARQASTSLLPGFEQPRLYRSEIDTISIKEVASSVYFDEAAQAANNSNFERLELERRSLTLESDTFNYRVQYLIETFYDANTATRSGDLITINYAEAGQEQASLQLRYLNQLECLSPDCAFSDTLEIDSVTYLNVYYLAADSAAPAVYINQAQGLVGFRTSQNTTYQRIK